MKVYQYKVTPEGFKTREFEVREVLAFTYQIVPEDSGCYRYLSLKNIGKVINSNEVFFTEPNKELEACNLLRPIVADRLEKARAKVEALESMLQELPY